jgi:hypothetical protein
MKVIYFCLEGGMQRGLLNWSFSKSEIQPKMFFWSQLTKPLLPPSVDCKSFNIDILILDKNGCLSHDELHNIVVQTGLVHPPAWNKT